jgi:hypothetical protein
MLLPEGIFTINTTYWMKKALNKRTIFAPSAPFTSGIQSISTAEKNDLPAFRRHGSVSGPEIGSRRK